MKAVNETTAARASGTLERLTVGSRVFYPGHGVVSVTAVQERTFADDVQAYYVLALEPDRSVKLMVPVGKVKQAGLRDLVSPTKARALLKSVAVGREVTDLKSDPTSRKVRAAGYSEALRSGSPERYTEALCELMTRFRSGKLSPSEQTTLQQALAIFVGEVSAALDRPRDEVRADLRQIAELPTTGW